VETILGLNVTPTKRCQHRRIDADMNVAKLSNIGVVHHRVVHEIVEARDTETMAQHHPLTHVVEFRPSATQVLGGLRVGKRLKNI
jgi:hypothetical protein